MPSRTDFIVRPPTLDRWTITRRPCMHDGQPATALDVEGRCDRRRKPLFVSTEYVYAEDGDLRVSDVAHHLALVLEQDRPTSFDALERGLLGEHYDQPELPF